MIRDVSAANLPSSAVTFWRGFLNLREVHTSPELRDNKQLQMQAIFSSLLHATSELSLNEVSLYAAELVSSGAMEIGEVNKTVLAMLSLFVYARRGDKDMTIELTNVLGNCTPLWQYVSRDTLDGAVERVFGTNKKQRKLSDLDKLVDDLNRMVDWYDSNPEAYTEQLFSSSPGPWADILLMPLSGRHHRDENDITHIGNIIRARAQTNLAPITHPNHDIYDIIAARMKMKSA